MDQDDGEVVRGERKSHEGLVANKKCRADMCFPYLDILV